MESVKQKKVASLIKRDMSLIISEMLTNNVGIVVTVTKVLVTQDLQIAKIYFSVFPSSNANGFLEELELLKNNIKSKLHKKLKNQLRLMPNILFCIDDTLDYIEKIDKALNNPENPIS